MKEILMSLIDIFIISAEINKTRDAKNEAIRMQNYEEAADLRQKENELSGQLPSLAELNSFKIRLQDCD